MLRMLGDIQFCCFKHIINLFPGNSWEIFEKLLNRVSPFDVIEQGSDWNTRAREAWQAALNLGIDCYGVHKVDFIINSSKGYREWTHPCQMPRYL